MAVFRLDEAERATVPWVDRNIDTAFRIYKKNVPDDARPYADLWPSMPEAGAQ